MKPLIILNILSAFLALHRSVIASEPLVKVYDCSPLSAEAGMGSLLQLKIYATSGSTDFHVKLISTSPVVQDIVSDRVIGGHEHYLDQKTGGKILDLGITGQPLESNPGFFSILIYNGEQSNWACQPLN